MKTLPAPISLLVLLFMVPVAAALDIRQEPCVFRTMVTREVSHETFVVTGNRDSFADLSCRVAVVAFPLGKFDLSITMTEDILAGLRRNKIHTSNLLEVVGHTCSLGSEILNQRLSQYRAEIVATFLRENGYSVQIVRGVAARQPVTSDPADNRRVEINLLSKSNKEDL
jgi:flagellar motor protein MotB